ncbi:MAG: hypothetical protein AAFN70_21790, partial [Planctomycetota bacterium]
TTPNTIQNTNVLVKHSFGWNNYTVQGLESYGFSGSGCTVYRVFPKVNCSIIFLSNGFNRWQNLNQLIDDLYRIVHCN